MNKLKGVKTPHLKRTSQNKAEILPTPKEVRIPMSMHIGAPAKPIISAGDEVKVGQLIAEASGFVSAPIYASVSGKVKSVNDYDVISGQKAVSVTITADGQQEEYEGIAPPRVTNLTEFIEAVKNSGVVGLGGAGFPTAVKLTVQDKSKLDYIIINGAECEPYITSDTRTMIDDAKLVWDGVMLLRKYFEKKIIIGIESNKPEPIKVMKEFAAGESGVEIKVLPEVYPQGGEKVLIYNTTGRVVPEGGLPLDAGVIVLNCTTVAAIARYIYTGMPLVTKCVTVDGSAVKSPKNVIAPIGTPIGDLFEYCGGLSEDCKKILMGGPMMGLAVPNTEMPILKNTNAVIALTKKEAKMPRETVCIRCGRCAARCPMNLMPLELERAYKLKKPELLQENKVNLCMECGCCAFTCPSRRPLVQTMKLSKIMLRDYQTAKKEAEEKGAKKDG